MTLSLKKRGNWFINLLIMAKRCLIILCVAIAIFGAIRGIETIEARADSSAEIAMELTTGTVLTEHNADIKLPMASTTKIMTAIIIIEDCVLDEIITVPDAAVGAEGSSIYLKKNEEISVIDLLYGLMLRSGNDAAAALAIHHSGSIEKFAKQMNEKAMELGAENTNFTNPSGLPDSDHFTTATDLCKIACHAMKNETFRKIVATKNYTGNFKSFTNKNKMLYNYDGANGVKTGYTQKAGRCLVSSAQRDGMDVICVVLNCPDMYGRSEKILDDCFNAYKLINIDGNSVFMSGKVLCKPSKAINFVAKSAKKLNFKVKPLDNLKNIKSGDFVAVLEIYSENDLILSENLYSIIDR